MTLLLSKIITLYVVIKNICTWIILRFSDSQKKKLSLLLVVVILPFLFENERDIHMLKIKCPLTVEADVSDQSQQGPEACTFFSIVLPYIKPLTREERK